CILFFCFDDPFFKDIQVQLHSIDSIVFRLFCYVLCLFLCLFLCTFHLLFDTPIRVVPIGKQRNNCNNDPRPSCESWDLRWVHYVSPVGSSGVGGNKDTAASIAMTIVALDGAGDLYSLY